MHFIFATVLAYLLLSLTMVALGVSGILQGIQISALPYLAVLTVAELLQLLLLFLLWRWKFGGDERVKEASLVAPGRRLPDLESVVPNEVEHTLPDASVDASVASAALCQELSSSLAQLRSDLRDAGAREERLRAQLHWRSRALMRLACQLTWALGARETEGRPPSPAEKSQTVEGPAEPRSGEPLKKAEPEVESEHRSKLLQLASASPELRAALLQKLRERNRGDATEEADVTEEVVASSPRNGAAETVARKLAEQAAAVDRWRNVSEESRRQLQAASQEVEQLKEELSQCHEELAKRKVINVAAHGPDLRLKWLEDGPLPGEVASAEGMKLLRQSLGSGPAQLCVGPPPADWKVFVQLRLRRASERWEPALLQLSAGQDEASDFLGLLWPTDKAEVR